MSNTHILSIVRDLGATDAQLGEVEILLSNLLAASVQSTMPPALAASRPTMSPRGTASASDSPGTDLTLTPGLERSLDPSNSAPTTATVDRIQNVTS